MESRTDQSHYALQILESWSRNKFYGDVTFQYQDGRIVLVRETKTSKPA